MHKQISTKILFLIILVIIFSLSILFKFHSSIYSFFYKTNYSFEESKVFNNGKIDDLAKGTYIVPFAPSYQEDSTAKVAVYDDKGELSDYENFPGPIEIFYSSYNKNSGKYGFYSMVKNDHIVINKNGSIDHLYLPDESKFKNNYTAVNAITSDNKSIWAFLNVGVNGTEGYDFEIVKTDLDSAEITKKFNFGYPENAITDEKNLYLMYSKSGIPGISLAVFDKNSLELIKTIDLSKYGVSTYNFMSQTIFLDSSKDLIIYGTSEEIEGYQPTSHSILKINTRNYEIIDKLEFDYEKGPTPYFVYELDDKYYMLTANAKIYVLSKSFDILENYKLDISNLPELTQNLSGDATTTNWIDTYSVGTIRTLNDRYIHILYWINENSLRYSKPYVIVKYDVLNGQVANYIEVTRPITYNILGEPQTVSKNVAFEIIRK
jgi:hypothetical protein